MALVLITHDLGVVAETTDRVLVQYAGRQVESARVAALFADPHQALGPAYAFISHDLGVVRHLADEVMVMYLGRVVEQGPRAAIFGTPGIPSTAFHQ